MSIIADAYLWVYCLFFSIYSYFRKDISKDVLEEEDLFARLPPEIVIHILSYLELMDLIHVTMTCKRMKRLSEHDSIWKKHFEQIIDTSSCCPGLAWRLVWDKNKIAKRNSLKKVGNFKQCFFNDKLHETAAQQQKKKNEEEWLHHVKKIHDLPQETISMYSISISLVLAILKFEHWLPNLIDQYLLWSFIFLPIWILFVLVAISVLTAWLTKKKYPHLLFRLDNGLFYQIFLKEPCKYRSLQPKSSNAQSIGITTFLNRILKRRFIFRCFYGILAVLQIMLLSFKLDNVISLSWITISVPFLIGISCYILRSTLLFPDNQPGAKAGTLLGYIWIPAINAFLILNHKDYHLILAVVSLPILLLRFYKYTHTEWECTLFRENFLRNFCFCSFLGSICTTGLLTAMFMDSFILDTIPIITNLNMKIVLRPLYILEIFFVLFSIGIYRYPFKTLRLSKAEKNSCMLVFLFILLPIVTFQIWLCKRIDEKMDITFISLFVSWLITFIIGSILANKFNLIQDCDYN